MKIIKYLNFFLILIIINISLSKKNKKSIKSQLKQKYLNKKRKNQEKNKKSKIRKLQNSQYKPIRILYDKTYLETATQGIKDFPKEIYYNSFNRTIPLIRKIVSVIPITKAIKFGTTIPNELNDTFDTIANGALIGNGILDYDLIIVPIIRINLTKEVHSESVLRDEDTHRTTLGIIYIKFNTETPTNYYHSLDYLIIHGIIHLLGFSYDSFDYFPNGRQGTIKTDKDVYGLDRDYIITPNVVSFAQKYFGCESLTKVPLENQKQGDEKVAHWESRILLGEIMGSYSYLSDQVISEFTLYLLLDSGWYQINFFTGGLMRFGKNKGCQFLEEDCSDKYKNEYYPSTNDQYNAGCSSGRQSRAYYFQEQIKINDTYNRYDNHGGPEIVEYCIIADHIKGELANNYYSGNCKLGNDDYGSKIFSVNRNALTSFFNESFSDHSFCILASIDRKDNNAENYKRYIIPYCYEMFCSTKSLTIKIGRQYIVCPKSGGKVEIGGDYEGYIYCPDYNLICTGTIMCNDVFECIERNSSSKENSFIYDYEIKTNQIQNELFNEIVEENGYEQDEKDEGKCPINCNQCYEGGQCFNCKNGLYIIGTKVGESINKCQDIDISIGYFKYDYAYYPCLNNCAKCENQTICEECKTGFYFIEYNRTYCDSEKDLTNYYTLDNGKSYFPCNTHFPYCEKCNNTDNFCFSCVQNYHFINTKDVCTNQDITNYFSEDGGILYYLCADHINNCSTCNSSTFCTRCIQTYYFFKEDRHQCYTGFNLSLYYSEDKDISYYPCDTHFPHCLTCNNANTCTHCQENFVFLRGENKLCYPKNKTFQEDNKFYPCNDTISNCDTCRSRQTCTKCDDGYVLIRNSSNRLNCIDADITNYYQLPDGTYRLCSDAMNNCLKCDNGTFCTQCKENSYFLKTNQSICRDDLDLREYYTEDEGRSYYPCIEAINKCIFC